MSLLCLAKILQHETVAPGHFRLTFAAPEMAQVAKPGQFVHVRCGETLDPLLRRPLSLHRIDREKGSLTLLYRVVGRGTELLSRLPVGGILDVMGPLGRGFYLPGEPFSAAGGGNVPKGAKGYEENLSALHRMPEEKGPAQTNSQLPPGERQPAPACGGPLPVSEALVVGGGLGVAPLLSLVEALVKKGLLVTVILGARSADGLLAVEEFSRTGARVELATDDGSRGTPGNAVDLLKQRLEQKGFADKTTITKPKTTITTHKTLMSEAEAAGICVYACGPALMLRAVWLLCAAYQVPLQVSLEERMGCGTGACLACVCKVRLAAEPVANAASAVPGDEVTEARGDKVMEARLKTASPAVSVEKAVNDRLKIKPAGKTGETAAVGTAETAVQDAAAPSNAAKTAVQDTATTGNGHADEIKNRAIASLSVVNEIPAWKYARVCVEGPVFWGEEVILDAE